MVVLQAMIKTAAISGIAFFWLNFTIESFNMVLHIISPKTKQKAASPEPIVKQKKVMCESCYCYFLDDGGKLCESCSDDLVRDQLEK